ncbi:MAG TPA: endolytic transglycosylase MltG [Candidatus Acidoferrales bacterium]|nr:endolytic transglycosylase MltG [Candidatus Acidoferrales bacterium]
MRRLLLGVGAFVATALLVLLGAVAWFSYAAYGDRTLPALPTTVIVPRGETAAEVGRRLARAGIIRSPLLFSLLVRREGNGDQVRAGEFSFDAHRSLDEVLHQLVTGGQQMAVWVTFPEGYTAHQMAQVLADHHLGSERAFEQTFLSETLVLGGVRTRSLEGFLFPSTYLIPTPVTPAAVARELTTQFLAELPPDAVQRARHLGLSVPQVVTVASLIEREAKADDERALMAGVYYNRLRLGMPLQVDATIEYTFPEHKDVITFADLARDSPYNTYKHIGLPPTPIANPGRPSLLAAFFPEPSQYLYYVYKGNGHHAFARTLAEHEANVARYLR